MKRKEVLTKVRALKKKEKRAGRDETKRRRMEAVALGEEPEKKKVRTQENTRIDDPTFVAKGDTEVNRYCRVLLIVLRSNYLQL